jgi:hypothetical protein
MSNNTALQQKRIVSGIAHELADRCARTDTGPLPIAFAHVQFKEGLALSWDERQTTSHLPPAPAFTRSPWQLDASIAYTESKQPQGDT